MSSPFFGLDIGVSGLLTAQQALNTSAHNVANANTPGYSRQRVTIVPKAPYTYPGMNRFGLPGQLGTGVTVAMVSRVRDAFLDFQIQGQTALKGEWDTRKQELAKIEAILPEPSSSALGSTISKFWNAWQDVATDPTSTAARSALTEQTATFVSEVNRDAKQLKTLGDDIDFQVSQQVQQVNDLARQLAGLNGEIQRVAVSGDHPNDLMDQRDLMLQQLSELVPTTVVSQTDGTETVLVGGTDLVSGIHYRPVGTQTDANGHAQPVWPDGSPLSLTTGQISALVSVRDSDLAGYRTQLDQLAQGIADAVNTLHTRGTDMTGAAGLPMFTYTAGNAASTIALNPALALDPRRVAAAGGPNSPGDGSVAGLIGDLRNATSYAAGTAGTDVTAGMSLSATGGTAILRTISAGRAVAQAYTFSATANPGELRLDGADGSTQTITVNTMTAGQTQILNFDKLGIQITLSTDTGGGKTAAGIISDLTTAGHDQVVVASLYTPPQTTTDFYAGLVGKIGADSQQAQEMASNQQLVIDHLQQRLDQTSGVSLDEEATDMIRYQHAYQAAARVITTMDEMLNTLINQTGLVGR